jgi:hypothetical protein
VKQIKREVVIDATLVRAHLMGVLTEPLEGALVSALTEAGPAGRAQTPFVMQAVVEVGGTKVVAPLDSIVFKVVVRVGD